jgi:hypothetical protein
MNAAGKAAARSYARAVERMWSDLCGRAVILSPREWSLVEEWHERGIPLQIVEEAVASAAERAKTGGGASPPRSLTYLAAAVEDGWMTVLEGRVAGGNRAESPLQSRDVPAVDGWRERMNMEPEGSALRALLRELIDAFERGEKACDVDQALDAELPRVVPAESLKSVEREAMQELAPYKDRMKTAAYGNTLRRMVLLRIRQELGLNKLSHG